MTVRYRASAVGDTAKAHFVFLRGKLTRLRSGLGFRSLCAWLTGDRRCREVATGRTGRIMRVELSLPL